MPFEEIHLLKPLLSEKFKGVIWKIELDAEHPIISVETRDAEQHITQFSSFNFSTGENLFKEISVEDSWHWGLDKVHKELTFLHSYVAEQNPEHKGIIALNKAGNIEWQQFNKSLYSITPNGLIVYDPKLQPRWYDLLNPQNGKTLQSNIKSFLELGHDITFPYPLLKEQIPSFLPDNIIGEIYFIAYNSKQYYAFHNLEENKLCQQLIISEGDKILLKDYLAKNIQKLNPEAFFISRGSLFCIRDEKREFVSYLV